MPRTSHDRTQVRFRSGRCRAVLFTAVMCLGLTHCSTPPANNNPGTTGEAGTTTPTHRSPLISTPSEFSPTTTATVLTDFDATSAMLSGEAIPGITTAHETNYPLKTHVSWFAVPTFPAVEKSTKKFALDALAARKAGKANPSGTEPTGVLVDPTIIAANSEILGIQLITQYTFNQTRTYGYQTQWYSTQNGQRLREPELWATPQTRQKFWGLVQETLTKQGIAVPDGLKTLTDPTLIDAIEFVAPTGDALVRFDQYHQQGNQKQYAAVQLPEAVVTPLLSDLGRAAQSAQINPRPFGTQNRTPTPKPTKQVDQKNIDCRSTACVAITFDDGPSPHTPKLLKILAEYDAPATFFLLGKQVGVYPKLARQVAEAGHQIGNHSYSHPAYTTLTATGIRKQSTRSDELINRITGVKPTIMRPPYGARNARVDAQLNYGIILWDVDTLDWKSKNPDAIIAEVQRSTRRGSIILLHDIHPTSVAAVPGILKVLKAKGLTPVTIDTLFKYAPYQPHQVYTSGPK